MSVAPASIGRATVNPPQLARQAINHPRRLSEILEGLNADTARVRFGCAKALCLVSQPRPDLLYAHFDFFVRLLDHENKILVWNATHILSHLARVDADDKFSAIFRKYFSPIPGPVMITAATVIASGARIAAAKPRLANRIATEVLKVARARYRTPECRNVAIGHAIVALGQMLPLLRDPAPALRFVRRQARNRRPATRKKAEQLLKTARAS
jgi:hypothetical protein